LQKNKHMKTKNLLLVFLLAFSIFSCKNNKTENAPTEPVKEDKNFKVTIELIAKKEDNMHLYFTEDKSINFTEEKSVWVPIKGSEQAQQVVFNLPEDAIPTDLRIDFGGGVNKEQKELVLKNFKMEYFDKTFEVKNAVIFNYFYPNKDNTILDIENATLRRVKEDQIMAPSLYPHKALQEELIKMTR
jgi:hypothetical protein